MYKKVHYFTFDLDLRSRKKLNTIRFPVSSTSYDLWTCNVYVAKSKSLVGNAFTRNVRFEVKVSREVLPSTSYDLRT